ncbi:MAG: ISAs1 family transposase, partial [Desulfobacterales bacterium]
EQTAYYIASITKSAIVLNQGIRDHWKIENTLHWTKDVVLNEDDSKIKAGNAPENLSLIKNWVMTVFRKNNYTSVIKAIRHVANDLRLMVKLLE